MKAVLLVEDEAEVGRVVELGLENTLQIQVELRTNMKDALAYLSIVKVAAIVTDLELPDSKGLDTIRTLTQAAPDCPIIVLTGAGDKLTYAQVIHAGAHDYLEKGNFTFPELARCILHAIERHRVRQMFTPIQDELDAAHTQIEELRTLVESSGPMPVINPPPETK